MDFQRKAERKAKKDLNFFTSLAYTPLQKLLDGKFVHIEDAICFIYITYEKDDTDNRYRIIINGDETPIDKQISEDKLLEYLKESDNKIYHLAKKKLPEYFI